MNSKLKAVNRRKKCTATDVVSESSKGKTSCIPAKIAKLAINLIQQKSTDTTKGSKSGKVSRNNNAVPCKIAKIAEKSLNSKNNKSHVESKNKSKAPKIIPIIQTRSMKKRCNGKQQSIHRIDQEELNTLNEIDKLTSHEIADGEQHSSGQVLNDDGVDLSVEGSDIDEDLSDSKGNTGTVDDFEPGQVSSSDEEEEHV